MAFYDPNDSVTNFLVSFSSEPKQDFSFFAKSYTQAASVLAEHLLKKPCLSDYETYPVIFLYRHAFELYLKSLYYKAGLISSSQESRNVDCQFVKKRRLKPLAETFQKICKILFPYDHVLLQLTDELIIYAIEFEQIDQNSYSFRYPIDEQGNISANHRQVVNLLSLHKSMKELLGELEYIDFGFYIGATQAKEINEIIKEAQSIFDAENDGMS